MQVAFKQVGRLPHPTDNVAIAVRRLHAGTVVRLSDSQFVLPSAVLEGHRFAVQAIPEGESLYSWGQPFGIATLPIAAGDYICNAAVLNELKRRSIDFELPPQPNFADEIAPFDFGNYRIIPADSLPLHSLYEHKTFLGYRRGLRRGVGTRNFIILLGTSALSAGFVRALETQLKPLMELYPQIDGIVAVAHTEGGHSAPNNRELLLRTLAGFMVNPNVAAVLAVDHGSETVNNAALQHYLNHHDYPIADLPHHFMSLSQSFHDDLAFAMSAVQKWLEQVNATLRTPQPFSHLKIALQCGGSDAFSGISGNPLAGWVVKEILQYGGSANLAETDELIGAEPYILDKVRDLTTAQRFVNTLGRFTTWAAWHGHSAHGNPSGGNLYRGLYNIYLKSLGASTKKHPDVRLDDVIDYGELMQQPGFYFMDSPGNDLESVAGQVAAGCNLIFFVTGNGSITNFPFVPTIKIVTTTGRFEFLRHDMDVNAGKYLDGMPMADLAANTLQYAIDVASGQMSAGERAGHAQVQIWRDWRQTQPVLNQQATPIHFDGKPLPIKRSSEPARLSIPVIKTTSGWTTDQLGLILPTSLCSGQIARMSAQQLTDHHQLDAVLSKVVALPHTEGCGSANGQELMDTLLGYLQHPMVKYALFLEHGCERTHNGYFRQLLLENELDPRQYGWASVQADGGIDKALHNIGRWFDDQVKRTSPSERILNGVEAVRLALMTAAPLTETAVAHYALLTRWVVSGGGTVVIAENDQLLQNAGYIGSLVEETPLRPTLTYAQQISRAGLHIMASPTHQWSEILTGLGATGIELVLVCSNKPMPNHPFIPVLQITCAHDSSPERTNTDFDYAMEGHDAGLLLDLVADTLARRYIPRLASGDHSQFQITRGLFGVSL